MTDPFRIIANHYPFTSSITLCDEDIEDLVCGLVKRIEDLKGWNMDYNTVAARQFVYLEFDYAPKYAKLFLNEIRKIKGIKFDQRFFKFEDQFAGSVQDTLKVVVGLDS